MTAKKLITKNSGEIYKIHRAGIYTTYYFTKGINRYELNTSRGNFSLRSECELNVPKGLFFRNNHFSNDNVTIYITEADVINILNEN